VDTVGTTTNGITVLHDRKLAASDVPAQSPA
jgi:hypothetical protein